jgi:hypothetical protein
MHIAHIADYYERLLIAASKRGDAVAHSRLQTKYCLAWQASEKSN